MIESYNSLNKALKKVSGSVVSAHEFIEDRIVKVTYTNGVSFLLNYNNYEVEVDGVKLTAMGYAVI